MTCYFNSQKEIRFKPNLKVYLILNNVIFDLLIYESRVIFTISVSNNVFFIIDKFVTF